MIQFMIRTNCYTLRQLNAICRDSTNIKYRQFAHSALPPSCAVVTKFGDLNFLEPFGPVQACNGTALPLPSSHILSQIFIALNIICKVLKCYNFRIRKVDKYKHTGGLVILYVPRFRADGTPVRKCVGVIFIMIFYVSGFLYFIKCVFGQYIQYTRYTV
jgi:hypothetical protein